MAKSIALAADASRLASLLLSYIPAVCAFVAPRQPGASIAIIDRLSHSRALRAGSRGGRKGLEQHFGGVARDDYWRSRAESPRGVLRAVARPGLSWGSRK